MTDDVRHEFPEIGVDPLGFVPQLELEPLGHALLQIWRILQLVDVRLPSLSVLNPLLTRDLIGEPLSMPSPDGTVCEHTVIHL